jgi:hypothetical protein
MAGKRIVFSCGNHDHHIIVRELRTAVELKVITGGSTADRRGLAGRGRAARGRAHDRGLAMPPGLWTGGAQSRLGQLRDEDDLQPHPSLSGRLTASHRPKVLRVFRIAGKGSPRTSD